MRALNRSFLATGRTSITKCIFATRQPNVVPKSSFTASARQYQKDGPEEARPRWTPHSLTASITPSDKDLSHLSVPSEKSSMKHTAYIALGSNLGNRFKWIEMALNMMPQKGIRVKRTSSLWETEPMYVLDQDRFLNGVCEIETDMKPLTLLDKLQGIEKSLGRHKVIDKGPRNIDLDILLYDEESISHERLSVPHPGISEREFVLRPLAELIPGRVLDPTRPWKIIHDYLNELPPSETPISTVTPLVPRVEPLRALQTTRQTHVMGIMNLTPDSFSDGGAYDNSSSTGLSASYLSSVGETLRRFTDGGASIIDIGGQSSAPKAPQVSAEEEISRTIPTIRWIRSKDHSAIISIDTYRASVAHAAINAGANIVNDISAGQLDANMLSSVAKLGCTVILMHMRGTPETMNTLTDYSQSGGLIPTIANDLLARVAEAQEAGVRKWRIILDPGIGFAKTGEQNLEILRRFDELRNWPGLETFPWLVGSSRKGFIGKITGVEEAKERTWGTAATVVAAVQGGADIVRVHDVKEMQQVAKMADAIWRV